MGMSYQFECPRCKYEAVVCDGYDAGWFTGMQAVVCNDCKNLMEIKSAGIQDVIHTDDGIDIDLLKDLLKDDGPAENFAHSYADRWIDMFKRAKKPFGDRDWVREMYHSLGFAYFYMIEEAKKKGIKQKSNHCPICGQKFDNKYPCPNCLNRAKAIQGSLRVARSLNTCKFCKSKNLTEWPIDDLYKCPKCGEEMLRGDPVEFWD